MNKNTILRVARPTDKLEEISTMYKEGLGFEVLAKFKDHKGFDGIILGHTKCSYHIEFTHHRGTSIGKAPTKDNLLVFYIEDKVEWKSMCNKMEKAGFKVVQSYNPYWDEDGKTFEDLEGYRVVLQKREWKI